MSLLSYTDESGGAWCGWWLFTNVLQVLFSHPIPLHRVPMTKYLFLFSDLNPRPRTIKVQAGESIGESIDLSASRLTSGDLKSGGLSLDFVRDD